MNKLLGISNLEYRNLGCLLSNKLGATCDLFVIGRTYKVILYLYNKHRTLIIWDKYHVRQAALCIFIQISSVKSMVIFSNKDYIL